MRAIVILSVLVFAISGDILAQADSTCTYDTCALRVKQRFLSRQLVRGIQEEKVTGFGLLAPDLSRLGNPDGSPNPHLAAYKGHADKGTLGFTLAFAALTIGTLVYDNNETVAVTLAVSSLGFGAFAVVHSLRAQEDLSRGVWLYNSKLAGSQPRTFRQ